MAIQNADLMVLGSGPGGYIAAVRAAQLGRRVTIVERESLGGVCLNWGCIPTKALLKSAQVYHELRHAQEFGLEASEVKINFPRIVSRSREVAGKLSAGVSYLMKKNKIEVASGTGKLERDRKLRVTDTGGAQTTYQFKDIIIATGARAKVFPGIDVDGEYIHTYRTILDFRKQPKKLLVMGAGAIGVEFAWFFSALGSEVTLVDVVDQILPVEDGEIAEALRRSFQKQGLEVRTGCAVQNLKRSGAGVTAILKTKEGDEPWSGDCCLVAVGVTPNTEDIGLDAAGIRLDRGFVDVNEFMQTNVPHYYAIGDVAGAPCLAHVASHEGIVAAEHACGAAHHGMRYDNIPGCTYCQPQVASVGLTEKAAREKGIKYRVGKVPFAAIGKAIATGEREGMIKVILDEQFGEVLGVHILHAEATELIAEAVAVRSHEGVGLSVLDTIHPHPTLSESVLEGVAAALGRPLNT